MGGRYGLRTPGLWANVGHRLDLPAAPRHSFASRVDSAIDLEGYGLSSEEVRPGDVLTVTLFWRANGPPADDFTVFVHLADEEDRMWGQHEGPPLMGAYPTSHWTMGLLLPDPHTLTVSPETQPGSYRLLVGMYHRPSLNRMAAYGPDGERWPDDRIVLADVSISIP